MTVYGICDNNCKHPVYTREEVLAIIRQAIENGTLDGIDADYAAVKKLIDSNKGTAVKIWTGTEAQFNAIKPVPTVSLAILRRGADGTLYFCTDDSYIDTIPTKPMSAADVAAICV